jgi:hypothetical protein
MKINKHAVVSLMVIFFAISIMNVEVLADKKKQESSDEQEKMIKLWKEYAAPGEKHKFLEYFVGQWESRQKIWLEPGSDPLIRNQDIYVESLYGGRFTKAYIKIKEKIYGMSIEATVITGYDNYKKQFVSVTFGSSGTEFVHMYGTLDDTGKIRTDTGYVDDVVTGERVKLKGVTTLINKDTYTYEMFQTEPRGNEIKYMEIIYTRKK